MTAAAPEAALSAAGARRGARQRCTALARARSMLQPVVRSLQTKRNRGEKSSGPASPVGAAQSQRPGRKQVPGEKELLSPAQLRVRAHGGSARALSQAWAAQPATQMPGDGALQPCSRKARGTHCKAPAIKHMKIPALTGFKAAWLLKWGVCAGFSPSYMHVWLIPLHLLGCLSSWRCTSRPRACQAESMQPTSAMTPLPMQLTCCGKQGLGPPRANQAASLQEGLL